MRVFKSALLAAAATLVASSTAQALDEDLMSVYKHLHANPELSLMEVETASYLAARLKHAGFEVTENFGGTGVVAVFENGPGKTIMLRADMDALPVKEETGLSYASTAVGKDADGKEWPMMHACGHDIHMTVALGAARELMSKKDQWSGTLMVILQPAEEISQGALAMLGEGLFTKFPRPDYNLALHANSGLEAGKVGIVPGYALANVDSMDIEVQGIGGHGAYPHTTKDPVYLAAQMVVAFQAIVAREISPQEPAVITVGSIHGGTKHNIIGESVKMQLTLRSYSEAVRQQTIDAIKRSAEGLARAYGLPDDKMPIISLRNEYTPSAYNNPDMANKVMALMKSQIGDDKVVQLDPVMGGEDFGRYGKVEPLIPSLIYWLGAASSSDARVAERGGKPLPSLHSPFFKPDAAVAVPTGVKTMSETTIALFNE